MPTSPAVTRAWLQVHVSVVLWGFTAVLGKLITLRAVPLVWWRMTIVFAALALVPRVWSGVIRLPPRLIALYLGIGVVVCLHWITFYASIKLANASVAVTCLALTPFFTAVIEPVIVKRKHELREILLGILVIPGVVLVVGGTPGVMQVGIAVGVLSGFLVAIFSCLNKRYVGDSDSLSVTALEMVAGGVFLAVVGPSFSLGENMFALPPAQDALLLAVLAFGCTLLPWALSLAAVRHLSAFSTTLALNLEPVYAILLATVLLGEQRELGFNFYLGALVILLVVFAYPFIMQRKLWTETPIVIEGRDGKSG